MPAGWAVIAGGAPQLPGLIGSPRKLNVVVGAFTISLARMNGLARTTGFGVEKAATRLGVRETAPEAVA